jgi:Delta3-Delta2-enoyl-CoA isomerase
MAVSLAYKDRIAVITLNKPQKLNALNKDEVYSLAAFLREVDTRPEIIATVLIGTGRFFSALVTFSRMDDIEYLTSCY